MPVPQGHPATKTAHSSHSATDTPALQRGKQKPRESRQLQGEAGYARSSGLSVMGGGGNELAELAGKRAY